MIPLDFFDAPPGPCWVNIDAAQLVENIRRLGAFTGSPILASVKANAYGHGYQIAAKAFLTGGASYLGVARLAEGLLLRQAGITAPVLIIGGILPSEMASAAESGLDFFVWRSDHIAALREIPKTSQSVRVHIKIDTGMGRLGCLPEDALDIARSLKSVPGVEITGLATHFASADVPGSGDTQRQIDAFDSVIAALAGIGIKPRIIHASNSAGALYFQKARYDMVRLGITAYGVPPDAGLDMPSGIKSALAWHTRIVNSKILPAGHGVSYGGTYKLFAPKRVGVLPVGYGDGFRRIMNVNSVLVDGRECKVLGRVCMDHCMIDLDDFGDITGSEAVLIGQQAEKTLSVMEVARRWATISYDVYTGIAARVSRRVV